MYTPSEVKTNLAILGNITFTTKKRIYFHFFLSVTSEILVIFTWMEIFKTNFFFFGNHRICCNFRIAKFFASLKFFLSPVWSRKDLKSFWHHICRAGWSGIFATYVFVTLYFPKTEKLIYFKILKNALCPTNPWSVFQSSC